MAATQKSIRARRIALAAISVKPLKLALEYDYAVVHPKEDVIGQRSIFKVTRAVLRRWGSSIRTGR